MAALASVARASRRANHRLRATQLLIERVLAGTPLYTLPACILGPLPNPWAPLGSARLREAIACGGTHPCADAPGCAAHCQSDGAASLPSHDTALHPPILSSTVRPSGPAMYQHTSLAARPCWPPPCPAPSVAALLHVLACAAPPPAAGVQVHRAAGQPPARRPAHPRRAAGRAHLSGMKRDEWVAPMPGRPCFTGL